MTKCGLGGVLVVAAAALALSIRCVFARTYVVGEGYCTERASWSPYCNYTYWAPQHEFAVGDTLVFNFRYGESTVVELMYKTEYDSCTTANYVDVCYVSPVTATLRSTGTYYFVSVVNGFCYQKLDVTVNPQPSPPAIPGGTLPVTPSSSSDDTAVIVTSVIGFIVVVKISVIVYCLCNRNSDTRGPAPVEVKNFNGPSSHVSNVTVNQGNNSTTLVGVPR